MKLFSSSKFLLVILSWTVTINAQSIKGTVYDENKTPLPYADVHFLEQPSKGTITDSKGNYIIEVPQGKKLTETILVVNYMGYKTKQIQVKKNSLDIHLELDQNILFEVQLKPISGSEEAFAIKKMKKMDIYTIPGTSADPLLALNVFPYSTASLEVANPALRGSNPSQNMVYLNNFLVNNPVRNNQLTGIGSFSIFNLEIIDKEFIYPSNPPLNYGNSTGGVIDLSTVREVENMASLSLTLANVGGFFSRELSKNTFIQGYSNYQFSDFFLKVNNKAFENINNFKSVDAGINFNHKFNYKLYLNSFSYAIQEDVSANTNLLNAFTLNETSHKRFFNVTNLVYEPTENTKITANLGHDFSKANSKLGGYDVENPNTNYSYSVEAEFKQSEKHKLYSGLSATMKTHKYSGEKPLFFYTISEEFPTQDFDDDMRIKLYEGFIRSRWKFDNLNLSFGIRKNLPVTWDVLNNTYKENYTSFQINSLYKVKKHQISVSGGVYHSISEPNILNQNLKFYQSKQFSIDYNYKKENLEISSAVFYKKDIEKDLGGNDLVNLISSRDINTNILGLEYFIRNSFLNDKLNAYFSFTTISAQSLTNSILRYTGANDIDYNVRLSLAYKVKDFTFSALYNIRDGGYHTSVNDVTFMSDLNAYRPTFNRVPNNKKFDPYNILNLNVNHIAFIKGKMNIVSFLALNNILNTKNQRNIYFNEDFTNSEFEYYQRFNMYFGVVFMF